MRSSLLQKVVRQSTDRASSSSWLSPRYLSAGSAVLSRSKAESFFGECYGRLVVPVGPNGFTVQPAQQSGVPLSPFGSGCTEIWQVLSKAPDDNPPDQPKTTLDRQDVPPTKPGMDAPNSPDATNPEIDRSDYTAPGTNPDVDHNSPEDYKPDSNSADDLKKRGRSGKSKLPGSGGAHASSYNMQQQTLFGSQAVSTMRIAAPHCAGANRLARFHVYATSPNDEDANVGKDDSAGATHPNLPGRSDAATTDKSDAPKGYDPNPDLMFDANSANKPKDGERKDGEVVDQDNTISSSSDQPRKSPEDVAPEQAGS